MNNGGNGESDWKAQYACYSCGRPVAAWDNGVWVHILMGQRECSRTVGSWTISTTAIPLGHPDFVTKIEPNPIEALFQVKVQRSRDELERRLKETLGNG